VFLVLVVFTVCVVLVVFVVFIVLLFLLLLLLWWWSFVATGLISKECLVIVPEMEIRRPDFHRMSSHRPCINSPPARFYDFV